MGSAVVLLLTDEVSRGATVVWDGSSLSLVVDLRIRSRCLPVGVLRKPGDLTFFIPVVNFVAGAPRVRGVRFNWFPGENGPCSGENGPRMGVKGPVPVIFKYLDPLVARGAWGRSTQSQLTSDIAKRGIAIRPLKATAGMATAGPTCSSTVTALSKRSKQRVHEAK